MTDREKKEGTRYSKSSAVFEKGWDGKVPDEAGKGHAPEAAEPGRSQGGKGHESRPVSFPIVGIGASAGGLEAFRHFFEAMPPDSGMAFVLVQHLDPTHESMMTDLLMKYTSMRVVQIKDRLRITPNTVYMIPPNKYLSIKQGRLRLSAPEVRRGMRMPIDYLFQSMAEELEDSAICVILSGTGADGTLGLRAVKGEGGTVFAQDPKTAQYDGMPRSAIATGLVDFVISPQDMPKALLNYVTHAPSWSSTAIRSEPATRPSDFQAILELLKVRTHHDFRGYKQGTLTRRIHRRMGLSQTDGYADYLKLLRDDAAEVKALLRDMLIGVTSFFRDKEAWKNLEDLLKAKLQEKKDTDDNIRVWVAGCSSGEEPYSIAMLLAELQRKLGTNLPVQIFASDIDEAALEVARTGAYPETIVGDVSPARISRFFTAEEGQYRINKQIRDMVVFANQNLVRDPPFSRLDLVSCRNLLIYLDAAVQKRLIGLLHFALKPGGFLFLGPSESIAQQNDLFEPISKKWRIYRSIGVGRGRTLEFPVFPNDDDRRRPHAGAMVGDHPPGSTTTMAQHILLEEYVPASVIVNRQGEALYYHGAVSRFLELASGEPTRNVAEQAKDGLKLKVRNAVQRAIRNNEAVSLSARVRGETGRSAVSIKVTPVHGPLSADGLLIISFEEVDVPPPPAVPSPDQPLPEEIRQLEYELAATREDLQSTIEELETSNEELKASNEEIMSMNEELQSTNEELETSKEELQSVNEELTTVNNQLQDKVQDLEGANNDMNNLLNGTNIATLYLDRKLRVRRFNPPIKRLFRLIPADAGRDLADIALRFSSSDLLDQAQNVLADLRPVKFTATADDGGTFLCQILPYRTRDDRIDGVILTFADISDLTRIESELRDSEERFRSFMDNSPAISWMKDEEGRHVYLSRTYQERFGIDLTDWLGKTDKQLWPPHIAENFRKNDLAVLNSGQTLEVVEESERDGIRAYWRVFKFLLRDSKGQRYVGGIGVDITNQMQVESDLRSSLDKVEESRKDIEFLATHDELTGLPNRALFNDRLGTALAQRKRTEDLLSLMFVDLDNFKLINDTLGHDVGDSLLREAAKRLMACVREGDTAARIGGDEFAVLMEHSDKFQAAQIAQRILDSVAKPYFLAGKELSLTTSIGIALAPDDGEDSQSLLKCADAAMYQVKGSGKSNFQFYTKATADAAHEKMQLLLELRRAITRKELFLVYQPEILLESGELVGVEALIRWKHPSGTIMRPDQFIGLAEESMLVMPLGELVLNMACRQMARWHSQGVSIPRVSVNLSSRHFVYGNLQDSIPRILSKYGLTGNSLGLGIEITEYALLASGNQAEGRKLLSDLKSYGVKISIDDFGTGYSSLSYLKYFPIDELKIDKSFVEGIARDTEDTAITTAILAMAKALGLPCVAEGVETEEQMKALRERGCEMAQGYLIGHPMSSRQLAAWTRRRMNGTQRAY